MATREEVLAAYAANPKASLTPTEDAIQFWMQGGLGNFNQIVDQARAQDPALAAQIDKSRAAAAKTGVTTGTAGGTGSANNSALYNKIVLDAYNSIGRTGFGTGTKQIDQGGYDFWLNALQNGTLTPDTFRASFNNAVSQYIQENPTNALTQYVQQYKPFQNVGTFQNQPNSLGSPAVPGYQSPGLAGNFANYMGIPIGAQYNPGVTAGGASPYSQIKAISPGFTNPYANVISNIAMGGYNPMLYENVKEAARAAGSTAPTDYLVEGQTAGQGDTSTIGGAAAAAAAGDSSGNTGGGPGTGAVGDVAFAKGGMVRSLLGPNPAGPDDGMGALDRGEYVIKKSSVNKYGKGLLDMINEGKIPAKKIRSLLD